MRFNFSSMEVEGDDVGALPRERPTDPDRIRFSAGDIVEEGSRLNRQAMAAEFGIPLDRGVESLDIAPVNNPFRATMRKPNRHLAGLNEYDPSAYAKFRDGSKSALYKDDAVNCTKDSNNRPVCYLLTENTATKRRSGAVADMQRAVDGFLNKVPMFQDLHVDVPVSGSMKSKSDVLAIVISLTGGGLPNPIGSRAGYDGWVGPSTWGLAMVALAIASDLNPEGVTSGVVATTNALTEAALTRYSAEVASFLKNTTENFDSLLVRYKEDPPPSPMLIPKSLPILKKKSYVVPVLLGCAGLFLLAVFAKKTDRLAEEEETESHNRDMLSPPLVGIGS